MRLNNKLPEKNLGGEFLGVCFKTDGGRALDSRAIELGERGASSSEAVGVRFQVLG